MTDFIPLFDEPTPAADLQNVLNILINEINAWLRTATASGGSVFSSRTIASLSEIPSSVLAIQTAGYAVRGDGGAAIYYRTSGSTIGGFQSFDGAWWGLAGNVTNDRWTLIGDANFVIPTNSGQLGDLDTMNRFATSAAFTAARTWTLPAASAVPAGWPIAVLDKVGAITNVNTLTIARAGSDTIAGNASLLLSTAYDGVILISNGATAWSIESGWRNQASRTRFWSNVDNGAAITTPRVLSLRERVFVGAAVDYSNVSLSGNPTFGWLTATTGPNWIARDSSLAVVAEDGGIGISAFTRASDAGTTIAGGAPIALAGFAVADRLTSANNPTGYSQAWGAYIEAVKKSPSSWAAGIEIDVTNQDAATVAPNPYALLNQAHGIWLTSSGSPSGPGVADTGAGIAILYNSALGNTYKFQTGIVFSSTGLVGATGADSEAASAVAMAMGRGQDLQWYATGGLLKARIGSRLNAADVDWSVYWSGGSMIFSRNASTEDILRLTGNASAVNYFRASNAAAAGMPILSADGADTDIDIGFTPKGVGTVRTAASIRAHASTAIPAGGTAGAGFRFSSTANFGMFFGSGAPGLAAAKGSLYLRSDGSGVNDRMYVNTNGSTTWTAVVTVA